MKRESTTQTKTPGISLLRPRHAARVRHLILAMLLISGLSPCIEARADGDPDTPGTGDRPAPLKRAHRMEFDERVIMGQSLKSGAIYLLERKDSDIESMVKLRNHYRDELLAPLEQKP